MATTHVFIVDNNTFKYHLEYLFVGTGAKDNYIDFNNVPTSQYHSTTENILLGMIADFSRIRIGDFVIFYVQQSSNSEGRFYGVFKVSSLPFLDNNDEHQFLKSELNKSLTFRALIEPYQVYKTGVTEWEALDEIRGLSSPNQMIWSLIYRKLKANRGNTMITIYESDKLINLIRQKNNREILNFTNYSFNPVNREIIENSESRNYIGRNESLNVFPRLCAKYNRGNQFETHLQAYILQHFESLNILNFDEIEWIGNEVSCGVGMQRIDIMFSVIENTIKKLYPIELKSTTAPLGITRQVQRYIDWIEQYYLPNRFSDVIPTIISRGIQDKQSDYYMNLIAEFEAFNSRNQNYKIKYVEFEILEDTITFNTVKY